MTKEHIEEQIEKSWKQKPSNINGLSYIPTIEPEYDDDDPRIFAMVNNVVGLPMYNKIGNSSQLVPGGPSVKKSHIDLLSGEISPKTMCILEIGVNPYPTSHLSTTKAIFATKTDDCIYLGVDVNKKSHFNNPAKNIHTMQISSKHRDKIMDKLFSLGAQQIDLLMIDGDHSINYTVNDWCFTEFLSKSGVVIMHDTNVHIGPRALFDAIDTNQFDKKRIGTKIVNGRFPDYGMCVARRLP